MIRAVLFDLDGTLLDTAADLGCALNLLLAEENLPPLSQELIRPHAGSGCRGLLKLGLSIPHTHHQYHEMATRLLNYYANCLTRQTRLFDGMAETLDFLDKKNISWGVVTNKPARFTLPLLAHFGLDKRARCIISGDTLPRHKPDPAPLLRACELMAIPPERCLSLGDMKTDVEAGIGAGTTVLTALYGYIPPEEHPLEWPAAGWLHQPLDLIEWLS